MSNGSDPETLYFSNFLHCMKIRDFANRWKIKGVTIFVQCMHDALMG